MPPSSLYDLDPQTTRRQREYDSQRATRSPRAGESTKGVSESNWRQKLEGERWSEETEMPSSKGEPTDPELREKIREEVKAEEKGGGKGNWSAWKAGEMARRYEAAGGDYKDTGGNKNKAKKGEPEKKPGAK